MSWRWDALGLAGAVAVLAALLGPYFLTVAGELPMGPHDWKQADCLAVAQRFLEDGGWNPLDPRILSMFPPGGRVNFELPLIPFLAAALARLVGEQHLVVLTRSLTLMVSLLGPLALFLLVWRRTASFVASLLPLVFLAASPVWAYYATTFLPDAPALGVALYGLALVVEDGRERAARPLWGIALLALAGLLKMSFAFYLLVPAALAARRAWQVPGPSGILAPLRRLPPAPVAALSASFLLLAAQVAWLQYRAAVFQPTFATAAPHPVTSLSHLAAAVRVMHREWLGDLFTAPQLAVLAVALAVPLSRGLSRRRPDDLAVASAVAAAVTVVLFVLFGHQLAYHDYYAIAVFCPLAGLLVVRLSLALRETRSRITNVLGRAAADAVVLATVLAVATPLVDAVSARTGPWWRLEQEWMRDARGDLEACGERCAGPVAVLGTRAPNLALVYLGRRGYVLGLDMTSGRGATRFASFEHGVDFLDRRGVRVLVMRWQLLGVLPEASLRRSFEAVDEHGGALVFVRREGPA